VERLALLLDRLPGRLGTRLVWRPWHRAKHRLIAWSLSRLTPLLLSALLAHYSTGSKQRKANGSPVKGAKLEQSLQPLIDSVLRRVWLRLIESCLKSFRRM